jgi:hypothetical protein
MARKAASTKNTTSTGSTKIDSTLKRKLEIAEQIHKLRAEMVKQNKELARLGADSRFISFW